MDALHRLLLDDCCVGVTGLSQARARVGSLIGLAQEIFETAMAMRRRYVQTERPDAGVEMLSIRGG